MTKLTKAQRALRICCRECRAGTGEHCLDMRPGFRGLRIKGIHELRFLDLAEEPEVTFDYASDEVSALNHLRNRYGVSRQTARHAMNHAVDHDRYDGRGYVIWITDETRPGGLTHTVHVKDAP